MRFRLSGAALAAVALFAVALPARADNFPVRDGSGATQQFCSKLVSALQWPCHLVGVVFGGVPTLLNGGQQTKALSLPVTLPSDPDLRYTTPGTITAQDVASTTVTGQNSVPQVSGTPTASSSVSWLLNGHSSASMQVSGTFAQTAQIEISQDGAIFVNASSRIRGSGAPAGSVTAPGLFQVDVTGMAAIRLRETGATPSGTLSATLTASNASGLTQLLAPARLADASGNVTGITSNPLYVNANDGGIVTAGALADAACSTDNGTCTLNAVLKRIAQRETSLITALGSPLQAGTALPAGTNQIGHVIADTGSTTAVTSLPAIPAGSNLIGKTGIDQTTPGTTNGVDIAPSSASAVGIAHTASTAAEACHVFKASAGNLYGVSGLIGAAGYIMVFDASSAPADGAVTPKVWAQITTPSGGAWSINYGDIPAAMATGITVCASSTGPLTKTAYSTNTVFSGRFQ